LQQKENEICGIKMTWNTEIHFKPDLPVSTIRMSSNICIRQRF